jgi:hypothetical protein
MNSPMFLLLSIHFFTLYLTKDLVTVNLIYVMYLSFSVEKRTSGLELLKSITLIFVQ